MLVLICICACVYICIYKQVRVSNIIVFPYACVLPTNLQFIFSGFWRLFTIRPMVWVLFYFNGIIFLAITETVACMRFKLWALLWGRGWDSFDFHVFKVTDLYSVCVCACVFPALSYESRLSHCIPFVFRMELAWVRVCVWVCEPVCLCVLFCRHCPLLLSLHLVNISSLFLSKCFRGLDSCVSIFLNSPQVHVLHHRSSVICCPPSTSVFPRSAEAKAAWISSLWASPGMTIHFC